MSFPNENKKIITYLHFNLQYYYMGEKLVLKLILLSMRSFNSL